MRISVFIYLVMFALVDVLYAKCSSRTSLPDISPEHDTTEQIISATRSRRRPVGAGADGADALGDAYRKVARGLLDMHEALRLQQQEAERREQENRNAVKALSDALQQQKQNQAVCAALDQRMQRIEEKLAALVDQLNPPVKKGGDALGEGISSTSIPTTTPDTAPQPTGANALGATAASAGTAVVDEETEKLRTAQRVQEANAKWEKAKAAPSQLGEDLCKAVEEGRLEDARHLLDSGADVNYVNTNGQGPLIRAFVYDSQGGSAKPEILSLLLERGADVNMIDRFGQTPLHPAAVYDSTGRLVPLLLRAGADPNARDKHGITPLHHAAYSGREATVSALLAAGARKDNRAWNGWMENQTPFDIAKNDAVRSLLCP